MILGPIDCNGLGISVLRTGTCLMAAVCAARSIGVSEYRRSIGGVSAEYRRSIGGVSVEYRRSIGGVSAEYRRSIGGVSAEYRSIGVSAEYRRSIRAAHTAQLEAIRGKYPPSEQRCLMFTSGSRSARRATTWGHSAGPA